MSTISVGTTNVNSFIVNTDTTGNLVLQTAGTTTALTLDSSQNATFTGNVSVKNSSCTYVDVSRGLSKAWVRFFYVNPTLTIYGSFNVSSVTRNGTGDYTINFTTAMPNINYVTIGNAGDLTGPASSTPTYIRPCGYFTSNTRIGAGYASGGTQAFYDYVIGVSVFSS
jgi:hypothetical protein